MTFEKPPEAEQAPEKEQESPEMSAEKELTPEAMEANEYFSLMRVRKLELEIKGDLTPEEQEELELLNEQTEAFDDLGGEIIAVK
jgi:hypothetical protein